MFGWKVGPVVLLQLSFIGHNGGKTNSPSSIREEHIANKYIEESGLTVEEPKWKENISSHQTIQWVPVPGQGAAFATAYLELGPQNIPFLYLVSIRHKNRLKVKTHAHLPLNDKEWINAYNCQGMVPFPPAICMLRGTNGEIKVVVVVGTADPIQLPLNVQGRSFPAQKPRYEWAVCVQKSVYIQDEWLRVAAFLEHLFSQGAEHVVLYKYTWGQRVERMLQYYQSLGLVSLIDWPGDLSRVRQLQAKSSDPLDDALDIQPMRHKAQLVVAMDCLQRMRFQAKYLGFCDVDELLLPWDTDQTVLQLLRKYDAPSVGSIGFPHSFFVLPNMDYSQLTAAQVLADPGRYVNFSAAVIQDFVYTPHERSKLVVRPDRIETLEVHHVDRFRPMTLNLSNAGTGGAKYRPFWIPSNVARVLNTRSTRHGNFRYFNHSALFQLQNVTSRAVMHRLLNHIT